MAETDTKKAPIEFWLDFSSPYTYVAALVIEEIAARYEREVKWQPFLLGVVMKMNEATAPITQALKKDYLERDIQRTARAFGLGFVNPPAFPFSPVNPARGFYAIERDRPELAVPYAKAVFTDAFGFGRPIDAPERVAEIAETVGYPAAKLLSALKEQAIKDRLREATDEAIRRGICGAPFFVVDGEPFWGHDRLPQMERWLQTGGW